jgi:hypothetical protein
MYHIPYRYYTYPNNGGSFQARSKLPGAIGTSGTPPPTGFASLSVISPLQTRSSYGFLSSLLFFSNAYLLELFFCSVVSILVARIIVSVFAGFATGQQTLSIAAAAASALRVGRGKEKLVHEFEAGQEDLEEK